MPETYIFYDTGHGLHFEKESVYDNTRQVVKKVRVLLSDKEAEELLKGDWEMVKARIIKILESKQ